MTKGKKYFFPFVISDVKTDNPPYPPFKKGGVGGGGAMYGTVLG
jgi:hypothetical protein